MELLKIIIAPIIIGVALIGVTLLAMPIMLLNAFSIQYIWSNLLTSKIGPVWPLTQIVALSYIISIMRYKLPSENSMSWWKRYGTSAYNSIIMLVASICLVFVIKQIVPWFGLN